MCLVQRLKQDLMEGFERQLQELIDDFVQDVEEIDQAPCCNGPAKLFKWVASYKWRSYQSYITSLMLLAAGHVAVFFITFWNWLAI